MKSIVFLLELFIYVQCEITYIEVKYPLKGEHSPPNAIWPHPQQINASNELLYIRPHAIMIHSNIQTSERLWSAASVNNSEDAQFRLDVHRCRLLRRGIPAQPILNGYCGNYELGMPESMINDPAFNYETSTTISSTTISTQSSTDSPFGTTGIFNGERSPPNAVWPHPQQINASNELLYIRPHAIIIHSNIQTCDIITKAIQRYEPIFFPPKLSMRDPPSGVNNILQNLTLNIRDNPQCEQYIQHDSNETYTLTINLQMAIVEASSVWGLLRGLETFSQLIYINEQNYVVINNSVTIIDSPRFQHRGVMLDTARHFLPVPIIKKNLDAMAYNKLNVFHWHIVDDQSFPFESITFPDLSRAGAFSPYHVYTPADVIDVIEHARLRGIRVIPEIDTPGHTYSWGKSMPQLITVCWANGKPYQAIYGTQGEMEIFNPIEPRVYSTMDSLLREVKSRFPSNYIHLGMDEVYDRCWLSNPNITQWMIVNNISSARGLHAYYADKILDITRNINVVPIVWQDVWDEKVQLPPDTIIQVWKDTSDSSAFDGWASYLNQAANEGYNVILSSPWYINYISYGKYNTNTSVMNLEFFKYYEIEPLRQFTGSEEAKKRILGGEACLWAEFVDGTNLLPRFWPKASAVAERLWSAASVNNSEDAQFRLDVHRCRLLRRGIPAQPILTGYCGNYELGMPESMINDPAFNYETSTTINSTTISTQSSTTSYLSNSAPSIIVSISANLIIIMGITLTAFSF
ncbi:unnamed protein product [Rotaria sp. Silwood1]|nr:unnamed protein product [Rotaria sp. Silwood1]